MEFKYQAEKRVLKNKIVIVINGKGGVGKDTICDAVSNFFRVKHISAITPIKEIAKSCGWNGEKDPISRKFLSDLKQVLIEYNQYPTKCLVDEFKKFRHDDDHDILFVDIREADQIGRFVDYVRGTNTIKVPIHVCTLLVRSNRREVLKTYGNKSDDDVEKYVYDYTFENNGPLDLIEDKVWHFFVNLFQEEGILDSCMPFARICSE